MYNIQDPSGSLVDMEEGVQFASTVCVDSLLCYTTRTDSNEILLSDVQMSALENYDMLETCLSDIYGYLNRTCGKLKTR